MNLIKGFLTSILREEEKEQTEIVKRAVAYSNEHMDTVSEHNPYPVTRNILIPAVKKAFYETN